MAEAAAAAARREEGVEVRLQHAAATQPADVLAADGYLFVTPENLASMSGLMKDFFDRVYYPVLDRLNGRPYAALVCAGADGSGAVRQIERIATGLRLKAVALPLIVITRAQPPEAILAPKTIGPEDLARCAEIGAGLAAGLAAGGF
jgi:multimeric flavodoxin WrbA